MRVESCESTNKSFKALYMLQKRDIIGRTDIFYANVIHMVKPNLENMAKDCDIHVKLKKGIINISVGEAVTSAFKRLINITGHTIDKKVNLYECAPNRVVDAIIDNTALAKTEYVKYRDYFFNS